MKLKFGSNKNVSEMSVAGIAPTDNRASSLIRPQFAGVKSSGSEFSDDLKAMYGDSFKGKVNINFGVNKVDVDTSNINEKNNLFDNIRKKRARIAAGSGEKKAKPGDKDWPEGLEKAAEDASKNESVVLKFGKNSLLESVETLSNVEGDLTYDQMRQIIKLEESIISESMFKHFKLRFTKLIIGFLPNGQLDKIIGEIVRNSNLKDMNMSKLKSLKRGKKIKIIKELLDRAIKNIDDSKTKKLEKESKEIIDKIKEDKSDNGVDATKVSNDAIKAAGSSMRNIGLAAIIGPIVTSIGILPAIVIGTVLASGLYEKITSQFQ